MPSFFDTFLAPRRQPTPSTPFLTTEEEGTAISVQLGFEEYELRDAEPGDTFWSDQESGLEARDQLIDVCDHFAREHDVAVFMCNPHGQLSPPINYPGIIHVRFYSKAGGYRGPTPISAFRRIPVTSCGGLCSPTQQDALTPSGQGVQLRDSGGIVVAEVVNNTIYVLFDLPHCMCGRSVDCHRPGAILTDILAMALPHLTFPEEEVDIVEELTPAQVRAAFIAGAGKIASNRVTTISSSLVDAESQLTELATALAAAARRQEALLFDKWKLTEGSGAEMAAQFDAINALAEVDHVALGENTIHVFTKPISILHEGVTYAIGEFRISLNMLILNSREPEFITSRLTIRNLTNRRDGGYHHPHVDTDGTPCLGNIERLLRELVDQGLLLDTVQLLLMYLQSYNPDSPHCRIENWL